MEHFYQNIHGWFSYDYVYKDIVNQAQDGSLFVEIGSFKGKSTAFMCVEIANSGKDIKFECIDPMIPSSHYVESANNTPDEWADYHVEGFRERLKSVEQYYKHHQMLSIDAAKLYDDKSIDFILIDGDHEPSAVKADVLVFLPKMKPGGLVACDDTFVPEIRQAVEEAAAEFGVTAESNGIHTFIRIDKPELTD